MGIFTSVMRAGCHHVAAIVVRRGKVLGGMVLYGAVVRGVRAGEISDTGGLGVFSRAGIGYFAVHEHKDLGEETIFGTKSRHFLGRTRTC